MTRLWPKADALVITALTTAELDAGGKVPTPRPLRFALVQVTGSIVRSTTIRDVQVTIGCTAATESEASDFADEVVAALEGFSTSVAWIPDDEDGWVGGPYSFPDPVADLPRYQMTVVIRTTQEGS